MSNTIKILAARVPEALHQQVKEISRDRGEDVSDFIRRAVLRELGRLSFLSDEQKKALEIS